jgi:hypothetical protein
VVGAVVVEIIMALMLRQTLVLVVGLMVVTLLGVLGARQGLEVI